MPGLYPAGSVVSVRALLLGERIDLKGLESSQRLAVNPLLISAGEGQYAALFRYGVVVLFGVNPLQEVTFLDQLKRLVGQPFPRIETEETRMRVDPGGEDRVEGGEAYALSFPLHMNASGEKFGKSNAGGNVWLDPAQTSPFEFYQYWFGAADADVAALLRKFTLLDRATIERVEAEQARAPERRVAQRVLARDITIRVHGVEAAAAAERESEARFGRGALHRLGKV